MKQEETQKEERERVITRRLDDFAYLCMPFGSRDIRAAIEFFDSYGLNEVELFEQIEEFCDSTDMKFKDVDVCYIAYDYILQMVRTDIDQIMGLDIQNDIWIDTAGNYMCTTYDWKDKDLETLKKKLKKATKEQKEALNDSKYLKGFLECLEVDLKEVGLE